MLRSILLTAMLAVIPATAQHTRIITDKAPSAIIAEPGTTRLHVLTAGVDANFDRVLDATDVPPRWFVIDSGTNTVVDSTTFDAFFNSLPIRVGIDELNALMYVAQGARVRAFDYEALELAIDTVVGADFSGVSFDPLTRIVLGHARPDFTSRGYLVGVHPFSGDTIGYYRVGVNPQMTVTAVDMVSRGVAMYTLNEGSFGSPSATISVAGGNPNVYLATNGSELGDGATAIITAVAGATSRVYVAVRGSNVVRAIDARTHRLLGSHQVEAPTAVARDTAQGGTTIVGAANARLVLFGAAVRSYDLPGAAGAIALRGRLAAVTIPFHDAAMTDPDSRVVLFDVATDTFVDTIDVGARPRSVFFDRDGMLHVIVHDGDASRWLRYNATTFELDQSSGLDGLHPSAEPIYDPAADSLFAVTRAASGRYVVTAHALHGPGSEPTIVFADSSMSGEISGIALAPEHLVVLERALAQGAMSFTHAIERATGERVVKAITSADPHLAVVLPPNRKGEVGIYAISGEAPSVLGHVRFDDDILTDDTLGRGANHLLAHETGGPAAVTMTGTHQLVLVDLAGGFVVSRIPTGTEGIDGPREAIELVGGLEPTYVVTTYAADVRMLGPTGPRRIIDIGGKGDGIVRAGNLLYVASAFAPGGFSPDSAVIVVDMTPSGAGIETHAGFALEQNAPNPASAGTRVAFTLPGAAHVRLEVRTMTGEVVAVPVDRPFEAGRYAAELRLGGLPAGTYLYTLRAGERVASRVMQVVR